MRYALALLCFSSALSQAQVLPPLGPSPPSFDPAPRYQGPTGTQYQYDLNRPQDQIRYEFDPRAQQRDSMSVDPRRDLDRVLGNSGGGVLRR